MKKILAIILAISLVAPSFAAVTATPAPAAKAPVKAPVKAAVKKAALKPGAAQAMTLVPTKEAVAKKAVVPVKPKDISFKDVTKKDPNYALIKRAVIDYEMISGYPDKTFRPYQTMAKAEVPGVVGKAMTYIEKKYEIPLEFTPTQIAAPAAAPAPTKEAVVKKGKTVKKPVADKIAGMIRIELAGELVRAVKKVYERYELTLPELEPKAAAPVVKAAATPEAKTAKTAAKTTAKKPAPVKKAVVAKAIAPALKEIIVDVMGERALKDVKLLNYLKIMEIGAAPRKAGAKKIVAKEMMFNSSKELTRLEVTSIVSKFVAKCEALIKSIPAGKMDALKKKYGLLKEVAAAPKTSVDKGLVIGRPNAFVAGSYGQIFEGASGTNNWMGFGGAAQYGDKFDIFNIKGNYEIGGKYGYNQLVYLVPGQGGSILGGVVVENRYDIDVNTVYPIVNFYGIEGKLLLGLRYAILSNPLASTNFGALNAGVATIIPLLGSKYLGRVFYSLIPTTARSASAIGQPASVLNYEMGTDINLLNTPLMVGYSGETMFINGGTYSRYYNTFFVRYNLI